MLKLESKNKFRILGGGSLLVAILLLSGTFIVYNQSDIAEPARIVLKNMQPGADISYQVFADGKFIEKQETKIAPDGTADLIAPVAAHPSKTKSKLSYEIELEKAGIDRMMDVTNPKKIVVGIDSANSSVTFKGSGFPEFSNFAISSGNELKAGKTDWSGMFAENSILQDTAVSQSNKMVKLAFQNLNIGSDADALNPNGAVEVFFGESSVRNVGDVRVRYGKALMLMTENLSVVMLYQAMIIGTFLDAKMQLETQRKIQELQARAHKDYHPSEQMCRFGTFIRSVANTESKAQNDKRVMNRYLMDQYLGVQNSSAAYGQGVFSGSRIDKFVSTYCDPYDSNGALKTLCSANLNVSDPKVRDRFNKDIDYVRTVDNKLTLNIDFSNTVVTPDEENILSLAQNIYFPQAYNNVDAENIIDDFRSDYNNVSGVTKHYDTRTFAAKMSVAHNSFINIVGMKTSAPAGKPTKNPLPDPPETMPNPRWTPPDLPNYTEDAGWTYMKAMMREFGIPDKNGDGSTDDEIHTFLGVRPSYYAQMEVLTKKIYQSPDFYTNLYDKPTNVDRIGVAMDAIEIMNQRDRYESLLRREMLTSLLVEEGLAPEVEDVNARVFSSMQRPQQ